MAFVEALADVEHPLGIHAEALGGIDLQAGEVIGQRRRLLAGLLLHRFNLCGLAIDPAHHLVGQRPIEHPPLLILPRQAGFRWQPLGGEALVAIGQQMGQHLVEGFGHEGLDLEIRRTTSPSSGVCTRPTESSSLQPALRPSRV